MWEMLLKASFLLIKNVLALSLVFGIGDAFGSSRALPIDPFYLRYDKASDIFYGEITAIDETDEKIEHFENFDAEDVRRVTVRIEKSWKGQTDGDIQFYALKHSKSAFFVKNRLKQSTHQKKGLKLIFFVREMNGKKVAALQFGQTYISPGESLDDYPETKVLDDLRAGKSMELALKRLSFYQQDVFSKSRNLKDKKNSTGAETVDIKM